MYRTGKLVQTKNNKLICLYKKVVFEVKMCSVMEHGVMDTSQICMRKKIEDIILYFFIKK